MATSFVEQATLKVNDQSSAKIRKINSELTKLLRTQKQLNTAMGGTKAGIKLFDTRNLSTASQQLNRLQSSVRAINKGAGAGVFSNVSKGAQQARQQTKLMQDDIKRIANTRLRVNLTAEGFLANMLGGAAASIGAAIARGFTDQVRKVGVSLGARETIEQYYKVLGIDQDIANNVTGALTDIQAGGIAQGISQATILDALSEYARNNPEALDTEAEAKDVVGGITDVIATFMAAGRTQEQAAQELQLALKYLERTGQTGDFDLLRALARQVIATGPEGTFRNLSTGARRAGAMQYSLSNLAQETMAQLTDTYQSTWGSTYRTLMNNLTTPGAGSSKEKMEWLTARGLYGAENAALFNEDPLKFAEKIAEVAAKEGVDATVPEELGQWLAKGFTSVASGFLADFVSRADQIERDRTLARDVDLGLAGREPTTAQTLKALENQLQEGAVDALSNVTPLIRGVTSELTGTLQHMRTGNMDIGDYAKLGAAGLAAGSVYGIKALLDPATAPLGAAGLALSSSAAALTASATALAGAAVTQAGATAGGIAGFLKTGLGMAVTRAFPAVATLIAVTKPSDLANGELGNVTDSSHKAMQDLADSVKLLANSDLMNILPSKQGETIPDVIDRIAKEQLKFYAPPSAASGPSPTGPSPYFADFMPYSVEDTVNQLQGFLSGEVNETFNYGKITMDQAFGDGAIRLDESFATGTEGLVAAGPTIGEGVASGMQSAAPGIGQTIGDAIAAKLQAILANAWIPPTDRPSLTSRNNMNTPLDTGAQLPSE